MLSVKFTVLAQCLVHTQPLNSNVLNERMNEIKKKEGIKRKKERNVLRLVIRMRHFHLRSLQVVFMWEDDLISQHRSAESTTEVRQADGLLKSYQKSPLLYTLPAL